MNVSDESEPKPSCSQPPGVDDGLCMAAIPSWTFSVSVQKLT